MSSIIERKRIVTAGSTYLDIDAYACSIALAELLRLQGMNAIAWSDAPCNYSVCPSLAGEGQMATALPVDFDPGELQYIIVDVSDPDYIKDAVPLSQIVAVYDHHVGFEEYWRSRIGGDSHIEFIGAAATLIFREWKAAGLVHKMSRQSARLLIAAILDNTLNLTSSNTTDEDVEAFRELCAHAAVDESWCAAYFAEVQQSVEADLKNALFHDMKNLRGHPVLPEHIAQLCVWDAASVLERLPNIRQWFDGLQSWMINIIDIRQRCSWFVCPDEHQQKELERHFGVQFHSDAARSSVSYLRKEIIKKTQPTH